MRIDVNSMMVHSSNKPVEGDRNYLELNVSMSSAQMERAIFTLIGHLSSEEAYNLLRSEFPEIFEENR